MFQDSGEAQEFQRRRATGQVDPAIQITPPESSFNNTRDEGATSTSAIVLRGKPPSSFSNTREGGQEL